MTRLYRLRGVNLEYMLTNKFNRKKNFIKKHIWKYDYLITKIIFKTIYNKDREYHKISCKMLEDILKYITLNSKTYRAYTIITKDLEELGIIKHYVTGNSNYNDRTFKRDSMYKITDEFIHRGWQQVEYALTSKMILAKEIKEYTGIYKKLRDNLNKVTIDYDQALSFCNDLLQSKTKLNPKKVGVYKNKWDYNRTMDMQTYSSWVMMLDQVKNGEYNFSVDLSGSNRVYSMMTNLPKQLRKFCQIDSNELYELDISNSQPLFFIKLLNEYLEDVEQVTDTNDTIKYKQLCQQGKFYSYIFDMLTQAGEQLNKETFKIDFFSRIFFSTEKKNYKWREIFEKEFPTVAASITYFKQNSHTDLAIYLQRIESNLIIKVCKYMVDMGCNSFFTVHDAIYTTEEWADTFWSELYRAFEDINITAKIKINTPKNYTFNKNNLINSKTFVLHNV